MVRRNLGLPHRLISKNFNCVIWVEIDGWYHEFKKEKDKNRQEYLESLGIKFFRVSDFDVKKNMMLVLQDLENFIINQYKL